jgi:Arc/MetJ-type ribon-helix-helix transcriptional regulator
MTKEPPVNVAISRKQHRWITEYIKRHPEKDYRKAPDYIRNAVRTQIEKDKAQEEGRYVRRNFESQK